jgi:cardiolipin synthase
VSIISVAIPVWKGRAIFVVDKGRPWSIVEHLLLEALTRSEWTATELATEANISRRVVVEAIIRLMRVGWVELIYSAGFVKFKANSQGIVAAKSTELPSVLERRKKPLNYIVDLITGSVFRYRDWATHNEKDLMERAKNEKFIWLSPGKTHPIPDASDLIDVLLDEDESFVGAEKGGITNRFVVATVNKGIVDGLPISRDLSDLRVAVLEATKHLRDESGVVGKIEITPQMLGSTTEAPKVRDIQLSADDLILDGTAHKEALLKALESARSIVFIHSTFIDSERVLEILPAIKKAIQRGVRIHVLWGQNEDIDRIVSTQHSLAKLRKHPDVLALEGYLVFHPFSTGSHAKIIVADKGRMGEYVAIVGSCNWLSSSFKSYEASVRLRDPRIVQDVVGYLSRMSCLHDGIWSPLASELVQICKKLKSAKDSAKTNARAAVVIGAQHNALPLRARDAALHRIFVASHRLGSVSIPSIVTPLISAVSDKRLDAKVYYCRRTLPLKAKTEKQLIEEAGSHGVSVSLIESPRLHAKVLAWDNNSVVISSLNWLSADQSDLESLKEIGIWLEGQDLAKALIDNFALATLDQ